MSNTKVWLLLLLWLATLGAEAESWEVYVNNRPFPGAVSGGPGDLRLEVGVLARVTSIGLKVEGENVMLVEQAVPASVQGETLGPRQGTCRPGQGTLRGQQGSPHHGRSAIEMTLANSPTS